MRRKQELTFCNIFLCLLVIFIHVNSEAVLNMPKNTVGFAIAYILWQGASFAVYGFIFLSGIRQFLGKNDNFNTFTFYKKRFFGVIIPYLLWVVIYYAYDYLKGYDVFDFRQLWYYIYSGDFGGHFYFVVLIVQFYLLMPLWRKLVSKTSAFIVLPLSVLATIVFGYYLPDIIGVFNPGYVFRFPDRTFTSYLYYWLAGAYVGRNYDRAVELFKKNKHFVTGMFVFVSLFCLPLTFYNSVAEKWYPWIEWVMMLYRMVAVVFLFSVSLGRVKSICKNRFLQIVDASSYNIYLCHCLIMKMVNVFLDETGIVSIGERYIIRFISVYIISVGLCTAYTFIKLKIRSVKNGDTI